MRTSSATQNGFRLHRRLFAGQRGVGGRRRPRTNRTGGKFCERDFWRLPPQAVNAAGRCQNRTVNGSSERRDRLRCGEEEKS